MVRMIRRFRLAALAAVLVLALGLAAHAQNKKKNASSVKPTFPDLVYATIGGQPIKLDLYLPADTSKPAPLLIHIHGGGWTSGSKAGLPSYGVALLKLGFAVANVDYRLTSQAAQWGGEPVIFPAQINDVKGAVRFLRAHAAEYHLDPARFGCWGESAGGHLSALLATSGDAKELEGDVGGNAGVSSKVQVAVDYYGPTDMLHIADDVTSHSGGNVPGKASSADNPIGKLIGYNPPAGRPYDLREHINDQTGPYPALRQLLEQANPLSFIGAGTPPIFIGHGGNDPTVPLGQSQRLERALRQAGVKTQLMVTEGAGHGGLSSQTHLAAIRFLCEALAPEAAARAAELKMDRPQSPPARPKVAGAIKKMQRVLRAVR